MCKVLNSVIRQDIGAKMKHIDAVLFFFLLKPNIINVGVFRQEMGRGINCTMHAEGKLTLIDTAVQL